MSKNGLEPAEAADAGSKARRPARRNWLPENELEFLDGLSIGSVVKIGRLRL